MGIIAVAIGAAVGMEWYQRRCRRRKREWQIEDKAIRFGEEGYIEGVVPIGKVKALARFYLMQHSEENLTLQQAEKRIEERLQSYIREGKDGKGPFKGIFHRFSCFFKKSQKKMKKGVDKREAAWYYN